MTEQEMREIIEHKTSTCSDWQWEKAMQLALEECEASSKQFKKQYSPVLNQVSTCLDFVKANEKLLREGKFIC